MSSGNTQWESVLMIETNEGISVAPAGGDSFVVGGTIYEGSRYDAFLARVTAGAVPVFPVAVFAANNTTDYYPAVRAVHQPEHRLRDLVVVELR